MGSPQSRHNTESLSVTEKTRWLAVIFAKKQAIQPMTTSEITNMITSHSRQTSEMNNESLSSVSSSVESALTLVPTNFLNVNLSNSSSSSIVTSSTSTELVIPLHSNSTTLTKRYDSRYPMCSKCRNHGILFRVKGHKRYCLWKECTCTRCALVEKRKEVMAQQIALRRRIKQDEELGLSLPLQMEHINQITGEEVINVPFLKTKSLKQDKTKNAEDLTNCVKIEHENDTSDQVYCDTERKLQLESWTRSVLNILLTNHSIQEVAHRALMVLLNQKNNPIEVIDLLRRGKCQVQDDVGGCVVTPSARHQQAEEESASGVSLRSLLCESGGSIPLNTGASHSTLCLVPPLLAEMHSVPMPSLLLPSLPLANLVLPPHQQQYSQIFHTGNQVLSSANGLQTKSDMQSVLNESHETIMTDEN